MWIACLNELYAGRGGIRHCHFLPSAAQARIQESLLSRARVWLRSASDVGLSSASDIRGYLRIGDSGYSGTGGVARLGTRSKFAAAPGTCDVAQVLAATRPAIADLCVRPSLLLTVPDEWPAGSRPRVFEHLDRSYDLLIDGAVASGAVLLYDVNRLPRVGEDPVRGGGFAVPKDALEDRWISPLEETNTLVDPAVLPPVQYPYLPQLGSLVIRPDQVPVVSKRDARNYYPTLKAGEEWWQWFPNPPLRRDGGRHVPVHTTWPMGFRGSCVIAQTVTDVVCEAAALPPSRRLVPGTSCPLDLPVWGSILDDVWCVYDEVDPGPMRPQDWLGRVDYEWQRIGVQSHPKKSVDGKRNEEIQGGRVDSRSRTVGLSPVKTSDLMRASLWTLTCWKPSRSQVERVVGKIGHAHTFRPCMRCSFGEMYRMLQRARSGKVAQLSWSDIIHGELLEATLLLPLATLDLSAPFCGRVICTDASSYGHGLAYTKVDTETTQRWSRACVHRGDSSSGLAGPEFVYRDPICPMGKVDFPLDKYFWHEVSRPGGGQHIVYEEFDASLWGIETRLHRPTETGCRTLHGGDSAACVASLAKGRSSTRAMNRRCRKVGACCLGADLYLLHFYMRSAKNPADRPSRVRVPRPLAGLRPCCVVIHLFSGRRRSGDVHDWLETLGGAWGLEVLVLSIDPVVSARGDVMLDTLFSVLRAVSWRGWADGALGGAPCRSWSASRFMPGGPRPIRDFDHPFGLPGLTVKERTKVRIDSELFCGPLTFWTVVSRRAAQA